MKLVWSLEITPVTAPRQIKSDLWAPRPQIVKYRDYQNTVQREWGDTPIPIPFFLLVIVPMPASWSSKKKKRMYGTPHITTGKDRDNYDKGFWDSLFYDRKGRYLNPLLDTHGNELTNDGFIWSGWPEKRWGYTGSISVYELPKLVTDSVHNQIMTDMGVFDESA